MLQQLMFLYLLIRRSRIVHLFSPIITAPSLKPSLPHHLQLFLQTSLFCIFPFHPLFVIATIFAIHSPILHLFFLITTLSTTILLLQATTILISHQLFYQPPSNDHQVSPTKLKTKRQLRKLPSVLATSAGPLGA